MGKELLWGAAVLIFGAVVAWFANGGAALLSDEFGVHRDTRAAKKTVRELLRDPDSGQFRNVRRIEAIGGSSVVCGEFNGKNAFGAYGGFERFVYLADRKIVYVETLDDVMFARTWARYC